MSWPECKAKVAIGKDFMKEKQKDLQQLKGCACTYCLQHGVEGDFCDLSPR